MNKRDRREQVMSQRYTKVDQRKQVSEKAKAHQDKFDAMMDALRKSDNPLAKQFIKLDDAVRATPNTRTNDHRQFDVLTEWKEANPVEAEAMQKFLRDFQDQFYVDTK